MKQRIGMGTVWRLAVTVACLWALGMSLAAFADTYNFYFKGKKNHAEDEEEEAKPPPPVAAAPATTAATAPIVINNNNGTGNSIGPTSPVGPIIGSPAAVPIVPVAPVARAPVVADDAGGALVTAVARDPDALYSHWKFTATVMTLSPFNEPITTVSGGSTYTWSPTYWGGLVEIGYLFNKSWAFNLYGGARFGDHGRRTLHAGADLEFLPFRLNLFKTDILEAGFLFGASTAAAAYDNWVTLHAGARVNINLGDKFGITVASRVNFGYLMFEGGLVTRL